MLLEALCFSPEQRGSHSSPAKARGLKGMFRFYGRDSEDSQASCSAGGGGQLSLGPVVLQVPDDVAAQGRAEQRVQLSQESDQPEQIAANCR